MLPAPAALLLLVLLLLLLLLPLLLLLLAAAPDPVRTCTRCWPTQIAEPPHHLPGSVHCIQTNVRQAAQQGMLVERLML
jgi:hypothetical protein